MATFGGLFVRKTFLNGKQSSCIIVKPEKNLLAFVYYYYGG